MLKPVSIDKFRAFLHQGQILFNLAAQGPYSTLVGHVFSALALAQRPADVCLETTLHWFLAIMGSRSLLESCSFKGCWKTFKSVAESGMDHKFSFVLN